MTHTPRTLFTEKCLLLDGKKNCCYRLAVTAFDGQILIRATISIFAFRISCTAGLRVIVRAPST